MTEELGHIFVVRIDPVEISLLDVSQEAGVCDLVGEVRPDLVDLLGGRRSSLHSHPGVGVTVVSWLTVTSQ